MAIDVYIDTFKLAVLSIMINSHDSIFNNHCLVTLTKKSELEQRVRIDPKYFKVHLWSNLYLIIRELLNELHCS